MSKPDVTGEVHLRPYQQDAIREIRGRVAAGRRRILVVAATGSGKTVIFARLVADAAREGRAALVIAHRRELIHQTYRKLLDAGLRARDVGILMANDRHRRPTAPVQVASIDTLRHRAKPPADLVILDEAHRELTRSMAAVRASYPNALHLGFTATPYRADNRGLGEFYDDLLVVASIGDLIAQGYLVEPRVFTVPTESLPDLRGVRIRGGDYNPVDLHQAVDQARLVGEIVSHWRKHAAGVRTVAFAASVKHSEHIAERFRAAGIVAEHLDGTTPAAERDAILRRLERGETCVVSNCGVLSEGWDQPSVKCAILARPTKSTGLYLQQAGRILRPWQGTRAVILDHAGCAREHGLPQDDRELSLEARPKRKRGEAVFSSTRVCGSCHAVLHVRKRACPECGLLLSEPAALPSEIDAELVEAGGGDAVVAARVPERRVPPPVPPPKSPELRTGRIFFEQLRAVARTRKFTAEWVNARYADRYGAPPPREWVENAWGAL
jgi:DNA repair protein RadD